MNRRVGISSKESLVDDEPCDVDAGSDRDGESDACSASQPPSPSNKSVRRPPPVEEAAAKEVPSDGPPTPCDALFVRDKEALQFAPRSTRNWCSDAYQAPRSEGAVRFRRLLGLLAEEYDKAAAGGGGGGASGFEERRRRVSLKTSSFASSAAVNSQSSAAATSMATSFIGGPCGPSEVENDVAWRRQHSPAALASATAMVCDLDYFGQDDIEMRRHISGGETSMHMSHTTTQRKEMWFIRSEWLNASGEDVGQVSCSPVKCRMGRVSVDVEGRKIVERNQNSWVQSFVSMPGSPTRMAWDSVGAMLIFYDLLLIPMNVFDIDQSPFVQTMDWATLIFWTINMFLSPFVGFVEDGVTILVPSRTLMKYLKTWFLVDIWTIMLDWMFSILALFEGKKSSAGSTVKLLRILRLVRMLRLVRLLKLGRIMDDFNAMIDSEYVSILVRVIKLILYLLVINHIIACLWYLCAQLKWDEDDDMNWLVGSHMEDASLVYTYLTALHWSLTQFTPASMSIQPHTKTERLFAVMVVVFALVIFSYLVGSITGSLTQLRSMQEDASKQFVMLRRYLRQQRVPQTLRFKLEKYLEHEWVRQRESLSRKDVTILTMLSEQLQGELQCALCVPHLAVHPLFKHMETVSPVTLLRLSNRAISRKILAAGDSLFLPGEIATHMYVVIAGRLKYQKFNVDAATLDKEEKDILQRAGTNMSFEVNHVEWVDSSEDWIAEPILWTPTWKHIGQTVSYMKSELLLIDASMFAGILVLNPQALDLTTTYAKNFLTWLNDCEDSQLSDITQGDLVGDAVAAFMTPTVTTSRFASPQAPPSPFGERQPQVAFGSYSS